MTSVIKMDIVGCGAVVQEYHVPILRLLKKRFHLSIRGCFDLNKINSAKVAKLLSADTHGDPDDPFNIRAVNCALIATPPDSHARYTQMYIEQGRHVFVEKPFATSFDEAQSLVQLSKDFGVSISVGHLRRYFPSVKTARNFVASGGLGKITKIEASEGMRWEWPSRSQYFLESKFGGVIYDTGSHLLDMVLFILSLDNATNDISHKIISIKKKPNKEPSNQCSARIEIRTLNDSIPIDLLISRTEPRANVIKIYGERAILLIPSSFSISPHLIFNNQLFLLNSTHTDHYPTSVLGCFVREFEDFFSSFNTGHSDNLINASNFLLLSSILESLALA